MPASVRSLRRWAALYFLRSAMTGSYFRALVGRIAPARRIFL
jgi:anti-sigma factor RsiW